ncbi:hypothetical protein [Hydrogenophaga sp. NFH-34]|uniref:hypothetical protein n=1 Tax=Hydrogenophaga sp. NFH-34 TaxID=2744446 RepID=UPI001F329BD1|nr:hypothetical protein [Hydrogenophaga sp. NFH-34]
MSDTERIPGSNRDTGHRIIIGTTREGMTRPFQESASKQGHTMVLGETRTGKTNLATDLIESFIKSR